MVGLLGGPVQASAPHPPSLYCEHLSISSDWWWRCLASWAQRGGWLMTAARYSWKRNFVRLEV